MFLPGVASVSGVAQRTSLSSPQEIVIHGALAHEVGYEDSTTDGHHFCHGIAAQNNLFPTSQSICRPVEKKEDDTHVPGINIMILSRLSPPGGEFTDDSRQTPSRPDPSHTNTLNQPCPSALRRLPSCPRTLLVLRHPIGGQ